MKNLFILMTVCLSFQMVSAQKTADADDSRQAILQEMAEIKKDQQNPINSMQQVLDVGEPDSFGKNAKFLGTAGTGVVYVYRSCDPAVLLAELDLTLGADDRCLAHVVGGATSSGTFDDLGRITIPGKSADNVIYFILNNTVNSDLRNDFANGLPVFLSYIPRLTIESSALNDPAAVDPTTGMPLNGVLTISAGGTKQFSKTIPANDSEFYFDSYSRAATRGFARSYFEDLGLPTRVINQLFKQPMTIKLGMRVSVRGVYFGQYLYSIRFLGN
jgi:hypothetical protein